MTEPSLPEAEAIYGIRTIGEVVDVHSLHPLLEERCIVANGKPEEGILTQFIPDGEDRDYLTKLEFHWRLIRGSLQIPSKDPRNFIRLSAELKEYFEKGYFHLVPDASDYGPLMSCLYPVRYGSLEELPIPQNGCVFSIMARKEMENVEIQRILRVEHPSDEGASPRTRIVTYKYPFTNLRFRAQINPYYAAARIGRLNPDRKAVEKFIRNYPVKTNHCIDFCGACGMQFYWDHTANSSWRLFTRFTELPFERNRDIEPPAPLLKSRKEQKRGEKGKDKLNDEDYEWVVVESKLSWN